MARVRIGTCANPAHAALVHSLFGAHGIPVAIVGEQHASIMGGLGAGFITQHVSVAAEDAERARTLFAETESTPSDAGDIGTSPEDEDERLGLEDLSFRLERRKRIGAAVALSLIVTFGTAHLSTGAYKRAIAIAGLEIFGIWLLANSSRHEQWVAALVIGAAIVLDAVGAVRILVKRYARQIPRATLRTT